MIRLGDGTQESHDKIQESVNHLWKFTDELFFMDQVDELLIKENIAVDLESFKSAWTSYINEIFQEATLTIPNNGWKQAGGRKGLHSEHMGYALAELQYMQRAYPNMQW
jgi:ring-1,2-phenylacetyl-CoA epoxidase subunit PaaC